MAYPMPTYDSISINGTPAAGTDAIRLYDVQRLLAALPAVTRTGAYADLVGAPVPSLEVAVSIAGVVGTLPGGAGAVVLRRVVATPFTLAAGFSTPFPAVGSVGTAPSGSAAFALSRVPAGGTAVQVGTVTVSVGGGVSFAAQATAFAAGDLLLITAPTPADATLADVSLTFTVARSQ